MSREGSPSFDNLDGSGLKAVIVAGSWHRKVIAGLIAGAETYLERAGVEVTLIRVAGSFEIPLAVQTALTEGDYDLAVGLGVIVRGETPHFEFVSNSVTDGLTRVQLDTGKPVGFGILTVDSKGQALNRAGLSNSKESKGTEAAEAALHLARTVQAIREAK